MRDIARIRRERWNFSNPALLTPEALSVLPERDRRSGGRNSCASTENSDKPVVCGRQYNSVKSPKTMDLKQTKKYFFLLAAQAE